MTTKRLTGKRTLLIALLLSITVAVASWFAFNTNRDSDETMISDVRPWAENWMQETRTLDYQGRLKTTSGNGVNQYFELWHRYRDGEETERLRRVNGPLLEIQRVDDALTCVHAPDSDIPEDHALPGSPFAQLLHLSPEQLATHYSVTQLANTELAGRPSETFVLERRESPRGYRHQIWLDADTHILLGYTIKSESGETLSYAAFESLRVGDFTMPISLRDQFTDSFWHRYQATAAETEDDSALVWNASWLPSGFERSVSERRGEGWYQLWTDGLARVSVLVEPINESSNGLEMTELQGAKTLIAEPHGDWQVVVIGNMPKNVTERIAREVSWQNQ